MIYDVAVIGMGLAGMSAALSASEMGATAALIGSGPGTLNLASGCIDVMAYPPNQDNLPVDDPIAAVRQVASEFSEHPYAILGDKAVAKTLSWISAHTAAGGWPLSSDLSKNHRVLTAVGRFKITCLVPESYLAGIDLPLYKPLLILGISGLRDFSAPMLAEVLQMKGYKVRSTVLQGIPVGFQGHSLGVSRFFSESGIKQLGLQIRGFVRPGEIVGIPPILPPMPDIQYFRELQKVAGVEVFEIPTLPPSLPGIRLSKALRARCVSSGVELWEGVHALSMEESGGKIGSLLLAAGPNQRKLQAKTFVMATGSYLSGGIRVKGDTVIEPIFDLPINQKERMPLFSTSFLSSSGHNAGKLGVGVDSSLRPLGKNGRPAWENLFAAGDILAGHDPLAERCGGGVAASSGRIAGMNAAVAAGKGKKS